MTVINTNVKALYSQASLKVNNRDMGHAMQALSTGKRINTSADDAAGLAISDRMTQQIRSLNQAVRNAGDAISLIQTTEGATGEINSMLQRMRELALQAVNDTNTGEQRGYLNVEFQELKEEITRIAEMTEWNAFPVLTGEAGTRVGEQPIYKAVSEGQHKDVFISPTTTRPITGAGSGEVQTLTIANAATPSTGFLTIGGVDVTLTSSENTGTLAAAKIKETLENSDAFGTGSGRTVAVETVGSNQVITITFDGSEGNVDALVVQPRATGLSVTVAEDRPAIGSTKEAFSAITGRYLKSGTLKVEIPASTTATDLTVAATFTDVRGGTTTMSGTVNRGDSTVTFAATGNNADIISHQLTYTFLNPSGTAIGGTANVGLDDYDNLAGTDVGRAVTLDVAVVGGLAPMNVGDIVINGHVIGASNGKDDLLSPLNNSAGSSISKAAAINRKTADTGVRAIVNENSMRGQSMTKGAQVTGVVFVNGVASDEIKTVAGSLRETRINAANAINRISDKTGVVAIDTGSDLEGVKLVAKDGRNIEVTFETTASNKDFGARSGLRTGVQGGTYSLESKVEAPIVITSDTGVVENSGLRVGDYTKNNTIVSTMDRAKVVDPVAQVDKVTIGSSTDSQTFAISINGTSFSTTASSSTQGSIRDALVTLVNADLTLGVTAAKGKGNNELLLTGSTKGGSYLVGVSGSGTITSSNVVAPVKGQYKTLQVGDLRINGVSIRATSTADDLLTNENADSSKKDASAIAIAAAINSHTDQTGVSAQVNPTSTVGAKTDTALDVSGTQSLYLNGVKIDVNMIKNETAAARREKVITAVNARFGQHGVTASDNGKGVTLTAKDGRNVSAWFDSNVANLQASAFGLDKGNAVAQVVRVTASGTVNDDVAKLQINGVTVTAAAATGDTPADMADKLQAAVAANASLKNLNISYTSSNTFFEITSTVAGSPFEVIGAETSVAGGLSVATVTKNNTGDNDVIGIRDATTTSKGGKTLYGTIDLVSTTDKPFTVEPGVNGYGPKSNFVDLGFREGTYGGKSSEDMSPPKVGRLSFQVGASAGQTINVDLPDFGYSGPITSLVTSDVKETYDNRTLRIDMKGNAEAALDAVDKVTDLVNANRAEMGAVMNRLNYAIDTLTNVSMNSIESRSRIMDADYAEMSTELARTQIIQQAATAVLAQANVDQQTVLRLLE